MHKMNLQLFAEPGTENSGTGDPAPTQQAAPAGTGNGAPDAGKTTYSQEDLERIATDRANRASQSAMKDYLKQQGLDDAEITEAIKDYKSKKVAADEASKGNLTKMQQKAADAEAKAAKVEAEAFNDLIDARAEAIASSLGIDPAKLPYIRLDFSKVGKTDAGKPKVEDIKAVLEGALKAMPELKKTTEPIQTGVAPTNGGKPITGDDDALRRAMGLPPKK